MTNLYQRYLVADQITKRMESVGALPGSIYFISDEVHVALEYTHAPGGVWDTPENREEIVNAFLIQYPDATLTREKNYEGKPEMVVRGESSLGIGWQIDFRDGVCERVQVGTKTVEKPDPDAIVNAPMVTVQEPVYEWLCPDPIITAGLVAA